MLRLLSQIEINKSRGNSTFCDFFSPSWKCRAFASLGSAGGGFDVREGLGKNHGECPENRAFLDSANLPHGDGTGGVIGSHDPVYSLGNFSFSPAFFKP
jgi:hypothetical protein